MVLKSVPRSFSCLQSQKDPNPQTPFHLTPPPPPHTQTYAPSHPTG